MTTARAPVSLISSKRDKDIRDSIERMQELQEDRSLIGESITEVAQKLKEEYGIPRGAINQALAFLSWDADKQKQFDMVYPYVRTLMGAAPQMDMFDPEVLKQMGEKTSEAPEEEAA